MRLDDLLARLKRVRRSGRGCVALCPAHDDRHHSLSLAQGSDRILIYCHAGCTIRDICDGLGIRVKDLFSGPAAGDSNATSRWTDRDRLRYAESIWRKATRPAVGTAVERYLRNRGITIPIPAAIRFCSVICDAYPPAMRWPALAAGIQDVNGNFTGVLVTGLCADGSDKMPADDPRRIYGPYRGGAVRLSTQLDARLAIGEGIETMLSVQQATGVPAWAALSASNLPHVQLPTSIREVIICADADPRGEKAAQIAALRFMREGRRATIARPTQRGEDFNSLTL
jgi:hypothetical protein